MTLARRALLALAATAGIAAPAAAETFSTDYVVTVRGLTVAKAKFAGRVDAQRYEVEGSLSSSGVGRLLSQTNATARSAGSFAAHTPTPESFVLSYAQGGYQAKTELIFKNGNAVKTSFQPDWKAGPDIIPVQPGDLQSVADPIAATIVARGGPEQICGRTLRVFEGGTRVDVQLSLASVGFIEGAGNNAVTCRGSFIPVAGMRGDSPSYNYLRAKSDMQFVYVPAGRGGLHLLHSMSARTDAGRVQIRSYRRSVK